MTKSGNVRIRGIDIAGLFTNNFTVQIRQRLANGDCHDDDSYQKETIQGGVDQEGEVTIKVEYPC